MRLSFFPILLLCAGSALAQQAILEGRVVDASDKNPLSGVHVRLAQLPDSAKSMFVVSDKQGMFRFTGLSLSRYVLDWSMLGHKKVRRVIRLDHNRVNLGDIALEEDAIPLDEVVSSAKVAAAVQKTDTTEFSARAFKTNPDATTEDLVAKIPGITVEGGTVKSQGEDVQRVLVDGRPFFGNDPSLALRNLPADAVEKIQVFDKLSDQAEFTGFDDGQSQRTMNIVTRPERRTSEFGKTYAGYGDDKRYLAGGNLNFFRGETRFSLIGLSNNVNQQNFSMQDLLGVVGSGGPRGGGFGGGGMRRRPGGGFGGSFGGNFGGGSINNFLVGQQNGTAKTHALGANYSDTWGSSLTVAQSYFFNFTDAGNNQQISRQYLTSADSSTFYNEINGSESENYNHRIDSRFEYSIDSSNSLILQPQVYLQSNSSLSQLAGVTSLPDQSLVNRAMNSSSSSTSGHTISGRLTYRHRFAVRGRTISLELRGDQNRKDGSGSNQSLAEYFGSSRNANDTLDQRSALETDGSTLSARLVYTEPVSENSMLQLTYNPSVAKNSSDSRRFDFDPFANAYTTPVAVLSNVYDNTYTTQNASLGFRLRDEGLNFMADVAFQMSELKGEQQFPLTALVTKTFRNILPSLSFNDRLTQTSHLRVFYRTSTRAPGISQLQDVVDNTNPLFLTTGNRDLKEIYTHTVVGRYSTADPEQSSSMFLLFSLQYATDYIANASLTARRDTTLASGVVMNRGTQLSYPVNLDGYWSARSFFTYGMPVEVLGSNLNLNAGYTYTRTPGLVNSASSIATSSGFSAGTVLSSNISKDVDFTLSYSGNYTVSRYTLQPELDNNYFNHAAAARMNIGFLDGFVFRSDLTNTLYSGLGEGYDRNFLLWNTSLARKIFEGDRGELRVAVTDLLDQNKSVSRTVTETYIEDSTNRVLGRYFLFSFTYTFR